MRVYSITDLMRLTRAELCALLTRITATLWNLPEGSPARHVARLRPPLVLASLHPTDLDEAPRLYDESQLRSFADAPEDTPYEPTGRAHMRSLRAAMTARKRSPFCINSCAAGDQRLKTSEGVRACPRTGASSSGAIACGTG